MKLKFSISALLVASGMIAATSSLANTTRDQVQAELATALRSGSLVANGETGLTFSEMYPNRYPVVNTESNTTREQVKDALAQAIRAGDFMVGGESSAKCNEVHPNMHPQV